MRALALTLIIAVPAMSFAQEKVELVPCSEQSVAQTLVAPEVAPTPPTHRWYFWTIAGVSVAAVVSAMAIAFWRASQSPPSPLPHRLTDYPCYPTCSGFLNAPSM
jgi:hypothetical protein